MSTDPDNAPRFRAGTNHVESWFVRANDPHSPRAFWLKATVLTRADGSSLSQAWFSVFDHDRTEAFCLDVPLSQARIVGEPTGVRARVGPLQLDLTDHGGASTGELAGTAGKVGWDLGFERLPGPLGEPMSILPARVLDARLPRNKLVSPFPVARFSGSLTWHGETWDLGSWIGMQGHNWGPSHSPEYAWGQCVFTGTDGVPVAVLEAASGRIAVGNRLSPLISMLVLRQGQQEYRFDRIVDLWRQTPELDFPRWSLRMRGRDGEAHLEMSSPTTSMVCLAYLNPDRGTSYCLNSKTAQARLTLTPRGRSRIELSSPHAGALEFLEPAPVPEVQPVV